MKVLNLFFFITLFANAFAQNKLIGYVTEQNSGKKPVPNTIINSSGANQNVSTEKGEFILTFQGLEVGENVVLRPEKAGWELVNEKEMKTLIPAKPNENPVKIVLCKAGTLAIAKQAYYKVADPFIIQQYNKKLAALDKEKANYQAEKAKLQEERNRLQNQLEEYAEEFIRVNLDDASEIERQAIALFKEGKIDESIKLRESLKSGVEIKNAVQRKAKDDSIIALHTRNLIELAKDYIFKFDFKAAEQKYEELVLADTTNFGNNFDFANFLEKQNKNNKAIKYYNIALELTKNDNELIPVAINLGGLYNRQKENNFAILIYRHAYTICLGKVKKEPSIYLPFLSSISLNLGKVYMEIYEYTLSLTFLNLALNTNNYLFQNQQNNSNYFYYDAQIHTNLGNLYTYKEDYTSALSAYFRSQNAYEQILIKNSNNEDLLESVANNLSSISQVYIEKKDYLLALNYCKRALKIREDLALKNPDAYELVFSNSLNDLGIIYNGLNDFTNSMDALLKALKIREKLAIKNKQVYDVNIAKTELSMGDLYISMKSYFAASQAYFKAIGIYENLIIKNPEVFEVEFCGSIIYLAKLQTSDYQKTRQSQIDEYLRKAKQILPKYKNIPLAVNILDETNKLEAYFKKVKLLLPIQTLQNELQKEENYSEKIKINEKIIENVKYLVANGYPQFANELGSSLSSLAWYQLFEKQFSEAEKSAKEALNPTTYKKIEDYDAKIEWANTNLALAFLFQGKYAEAEKIYVALKDKPYNKATYRETFLADLVELEKAGITHPDVVKIRELLKK